MSRANETRSEWVDFRKVEAEALPRLEGVLRALFPNGRRDGSEFRIGSLAGEKGDSLGIRISGEKAGVWADFATGDSGCGLIGLVAASRGTTRTEAARLLADMLGI
jgi:twinkle protein